MNASLLTQRLLQNQVEIILPSINLTLMVPEIQLAFHSQLRLWFMEQVFAPRGSSPNVTLLPSDEGGKFGALLKARKPESVCCNRSFRLLYAVTVFLLR